MDEWADDFRQWRLSHALKDASGIFSHPALSEIGEGPIVLRTVDSRRICGPNFDGHGLGEAIPPQLRDNLLGLRLPVGHVFPPFPKHSRGPLQWRRISGATCVAPYSRRPSHSSAKTSIFESWMLFTECFRGWHYQFG